MFLLTYLLIEITEGIGYDFVADLATTSCLASTKVALPTRTILMASCHEITCIGRYELSNFNTRQFNISPYSFSMSTVDITSSISSIYPSTFFLLLGLYLHISSSFFFLSSKYLFGCSIIASFSASAPMSTLNSG